jgi:hypothetical protein
MNRLACCAALVATLGAMATPAQAYVRTRSKAGTPIAWRAPQVDLVVARPSSSFGTSAETFLSTVVRSAATWSHEAIPCGDVDLRVNPVLVPKGVVRNDGTNTVLVTEEGWTHKLAAIALTTVFLRNLPGQPEDGEILDADIEINSNNYTWADIPDDATSLRDYLNDEDLRNALTHEMGHLLGLWHNCHADDEEALPDDQGNLSPNCRNVTGDMMSATMFPSTEFAATDKRTLSDDELRAVCEIYPYTYQLVGAGCSVTSRFIAASGTEKSRSRPTTGLLGGAALGLLTAVVLRRRRRRG